MTAMNSIKGKLVKHGTASCEHPPRRERVASQNIWGKKTKLPKLRISFVFKRSLGFFFFFY